MGRKTNKLLNKRFYESYSDFDYYICEKYKFAEDGVGKYMKKMKECYLEAKEAIPEWEVTYDRLEHLHTRFHRLKNSESEFTDFQGKDEDVVWMQVFYEKLDAGADPLAKYSKLSFDKKKDNGLIGAIKKALGL